LVELRLEGFKNWTKRKKNKTYVAIVMEGVSFELKGEDEEYTRW
jgi:hypothetical protein